MDDWNNDVEGSLIKYLLNDTDFTKNKKYMFPIQKENGRRRAEVYHEFE